MMKVPGTGFTCAHLPPEKTCSPGFSSVAKIVKTPQSVCAPAPYMPCNAWSQLSQQVPLDWLGMLSHASVSNRFWCLFDTDYSCQCQTGLLHDVWQQNGMRKAFSRDIYFFVTLLTTAHDICNTAHSTVAGVQNKSAPHLAVTSAHCSEVA